MLQKKHQKTIASDKQIAISNLSEKILEMEEKIPKTKPKQLDQHLELLQKTKVDLDELLQEKIRGIIFRTKARWHELGENQFEIFLQPRKK